MGVVRQRGRPLVLASLCLLSGCTLAEVQVNVVSERTALENQVLGAYNALSRETLLVASVRGVDPTGHIPPLPRQSRDRKDALEAMEVLSFHADDCDAFKRLGWVGENREGLLTPFPMKREGVPEDLKEFAARYGEEEFRTVLAEVNASRERVMESVLGSTEGATREDLPRVRAVFAAMNREAARPGEKIQREDGTWTVK